MGTHFVLVLVSSFVVLSVGTNDVLDNVNKAIVLELKHSHGIQDISEAEFLHQFVVTIPQTDDTRGETVSINNYTDVCRDGAKLSQCRSALRHHCFDVRSLLSSQLDTVGSNMTLVDMFPMLVYQLYRNNCTSNKQTVPETESYQQTVKISSAKVWGYGLSFGVAVCVISNIGGLLTPLMKKAFFQRILLFCVALAVGSLATTGFLVLIPESMHLTGPDSLIPDYHFKMITVMAGVYFFYISEQCLKMWFGRKRKHIEPDEEVEIKALIMSPLVENGTGNGHSHIDLESDVKTKTIESKTNTTIKTVDGETKKPKKAKRIATVAWMILVGDALHNFVDGLSIGAAFTQNIYLGMSVSLAVICEELPHELGDIAILLHSGMSMKRALLYNFIAATTILVGLVIGIIVGENTSANIWIFAVAGGMFVYISLVDMLPEMADQAKHVIENNIETPGTTMLIQNAGLLSGFTVILMLVLYGGNIGV